MTEKPGDGITTWHPQHIGDESFARKLTVELHHSWENVLQQSVRQSIQRAQDRSKDCPLLDAFCDVAKSTGSKVPIPLWPSDHQSPRWCNQLVTLLFERSEKPHPNASPTASFPMALEESATSIHGVVSLGVTWRWPVDSVVPEDH